MEIDAEREIIELLTGGPSSLRPLRSRLPRTTIYEALGRLRARGAVVPGERAGTWRLMAGVVAPPAAAPPPPPNAWPTLPGAEQHLAVLPSREHRAMGRLVLLAATARRYYEHHHASLVLYSSSGLRGKTFVGRWAVLALGGGEVLHAVAEGGRSLGARRKSDGQVAAVRAALGGPVVMIDEWRRGAGDVRRITTLLIHGDTALPLESDRIVVKAVVLLAMNSPAAAASVEEATGLDAAMIRRCIVADMERVALDERFARDGEERLDAVRSLGPVTLPQIRADIDERAVRDRIADALEVVLDSPERMGSLDLVLLGQLAVAAIAWGLSVEDAVLLVVHDAATLWTTTGWTAPGWEAALSEVMIPAETGVAVEEPMPVAVNDLDYDYEARLVEVDRAVRDARVELGDLPGVLRDGAALRSLGLGFDDVEGLRAILGLVDRPRLELLGVLDELGLDAHEARAALEGQLAAGQLLALDAEQVEALARELARVGEPQALAAWVAAVVRRHGSLRRMLRGAERLVSARRQEAAKVARDLSILAERVRRLDQVLERERRRGHGAAIDRADDEIGAKVVRRIVAGGRSRRA